MSDNIVSVLDVESKVRRGAKLLDECRPGWGKAIDLNRLDVARCCDCVLGQAFARPGRTAVEAFTDGVCALGIELPDTAVIDYGFGVNVAVPPGGAAEKFACDLLTKEWRRLIGERVAHNTLEPAGV